MILPTSDQ